MNFRSAMDRKDRATASLLKRVLVSCASQAKQYGGCVAAKVPKVERDMCLKEFIALKSCMQNTKLSISVVKLGAVEENFYIHDIEANVVIDLELLYAVVFKVHIGEPVLMIFSWKTVPFNPAVAYTSDTITEGPILSVRYSLDLKIIAIQRSSHEIQFLIRETGQTFSQKCRQESESILGFFWTDCPLCNIVFVKTSGLDLFAYSSDSKSLHLVESKKLNVSCYAYTHESRLVLMASGLQCKTFHGFQLSAAGIVRLPKFEMTMAKSDANSKPVLAIEDVFIITVYGRIYCLQVDRLAMLLHTYRFYRDAVVQQGSLPIYSSSIAVSVVDNVLLVHQVDAKVVILYDIFTDSRAPISAPLPLLSRGFPGPNIDVRSSKQDNATLEDDAVPDEAIVYGDGWKFLVPDLICDHVNKLVWKIHIDLEAIASSSSEVPSLLEFLQRRKLEVSKAKQLCLTLTRTTILEHRPVASVAKAIEVLISSYIRTTKVGPNNKESKTDRSQSVVPQDSGSGPVPGSNNRDSAAGVESEALHRTSIFPSSDSEENADIKQLNTVPGNHQSIVEAQASSSQYQHLGPGCIRLNDDVSDEGSMISSPSISPDEMYSFVFAPIEEEIVGDPSYLLAIIIEFLRRYSIFFQFQSVLNSLVETAKQGLVLIAACQFFTHVFNVKWL
ncbi:hypothetical protein Csa_002376 [Cucumis sativus]|nr:hypothetical protein Csa_002376 [Cucumis sativus]